jgi:hypothetical protein
MGKTLSMRGAAMGAVLVGGSAGAMAQSATTLPTIVIQSLPAVKAQPAVPQPRPAPKSAGASQPAPAPAPVADPAPVVAAEAAATAAPSSAWPPSPDALRGDIPLVGLANSASSGIIGQDRLEARSPFRPAEILEAVPGLVITQHSGEGKANQCYLRGFNLDHGTDLAIFFDGMPVNMPTHGHGQGYADMNFMIPELARGLSFHKGPYFADEGNFASAGAIRIDYVDKLARNIGQIEVGSFGYRRALGAMSAPTGSGNTLVAAALQSYDRPRARPDDLRKATGVVRFSNGTRDNGWALTGMGYSAKWYATDQIPQRAVDQGRSAASAISTTPTAAMRAATVFRHAGPNATATRRPASAPTRSAATSICSPMSRTSSTMTSMATSSTGWIGAQCWVDGRRRFSMEPSSMA